MEQNEIVLSASVWAQGEDLLCSVFEANMSEPVRSGDVIGFISPNISIAFSNTSIEQIDAGNDSSIPSSTSGHVALVRAIIG